MQITIIITAGGIGKRMGSKLPKQFLALNGKPILLQTLERFHTLLPDAQIIITLPKTWQSYWKEQLLKLHVNIPYELVDGGAERFYSVKNALALAAGNWILVHDAVRPLFSEETVMRCLKALETNEVVVPVLPVRESLRKITGNRNESLDRRQYVMIQTPQCFQRKSLIKSYEQPYVDAFTDDASAAEQIGIPIFLVDGNEENIKLTTPMDLKLAEILLRKFSNKNIS